MHSHLHSHMRVHALALALTYPRACRRAKEKASCQRLSLFKLSSVSKRKLQEKNKKLHTKLKAKVKGKDDLSRQAKDAEALAKYWEEEHSKLQQELEGESDSTRTRTPKLRSRRPHTHVITPHRDEMSRPPGAMDGRDDQS